MQFRILTALVVFIGSYLPLSLILLAQNFDYGAIGRPVCWPPNRDDCSIPVNSPGFSIGILAITLACFAAAVLVLHFIQPRQEIVVIESDYIPTDLMNYTLPYVVSFMGIDYHDTGKFVGFLVFLGWMFWITHKSGQVILNPLLIALGWRLYAVTYRFAGSTDAHKTKALVLGHLSPGTFRQWPLQDIQIIKP